MIFTATVLLGSALGVSLSERTACAMPLEPVPSNTAFQARMVQETEDGLRIVHTVTVDQI